MGFIFPDDVLLFFRRWRKIYKEQRRAGKEGTRMGSEPLVNWDAWLFFHRWWKHILAGLVVGLVSLYLIGNQVFAFGRYQIIQDNPYIVRLDRRTGELRAFIIAGSQSRSGPDVVFVEKGHYPGDEGIW